MYAQTHHAEAAIDAAFTDKTDTTVLFYLPVSKSFMRLIVLGLVLIAKASYRDVMQFLRDHFDYPILLGTVAGIIDNAGNRAASINGGSDLSTIRDSAADEAFHRHRPILTTVDIPSRFCALLAKEDHRDAESWSVHLLDLKARGFKPEMNISDQASGLKKAFEDVLSKTELRFDIHPPNYYAQSEKLEARLGRIACQQSSETATLALYLGQFQYRGRSTIGQITRHPVNSA